MAKCRSAGGDAGRAVKANGRPVRSLGDLCVIRPPKAETRTRLGVDAQVSFLPMEDLGIDQKFPKPIQSRRLDEVEGSYTYFADGDLLLAKITPCFQNGKLGIAKGLINGVGFGSSEFIVLRPSAELDREYLYYFLSRDEFRQEGVARMGGSVGQQRVPPNYVLSERIPVPPLAEQRRIVGVLDQAFAGIATAKANAEKNLRNARELFDSLVNGVVAPRATWKTLSAEQVSTHIVDCPHSTPKWSEAGLVCLRTTNFHANGLQLEAVRYVSEKTYGERIARLEPREGDVLYSREGGILGIACLFPQGLKACLGQRMMQFRLNDSIVLPGYFSAVLNSAPILKLVRKLTGGAAAPHLNIRDIRQFPIPVPPIAEQSEIVRCLSAYATESQHLESLYQQKLAALAALKKSLLHQALSGHLKGRTGPIWERIRA